MSINGPGSSSLSTSPRRPRCCCLTTKARVSATSHPFFANIIARVALHRRIKYAGWWPLRCSPISLSCLINELLCDVDAPDVSNPTGKNSFPTRRTRSSIFSFRGPPFLSRLCFSLFLAAAPTESVRARSSAAEMLSRHESESTTVTSTTRSPPPRPMPSNTTSPGFSLLPGRMSG